MANGLLKKIALAGMVGASAMFGAKDVNAASIPWSSYADIVPTIAPEGYENPFEGQPISSITYSSSSNVSAPNNFSAIYFLVDNGIHSPVGGFDVRGGVVTSASFNGLSTWYGLSSKETANSDGLPTTSDDIDAGGYWKVFYDRKKLDGSAGSDYILGKIVVDDKGSFLYFDDFNERLADNEYNISQFTAYGTTPGTFTFSTEIVPEPSTLTLLALGAATVGLSRRRRK